MTKGILGRKVGMTQIFDESGNVHPGDRRCRPALVTCSRFAPRSATATRQCSSAFSISPAAWPAAVNVVMLPSSTASGPRSSRSGRRASSPTRPIASRSDSFASSAAPPAKLKVGQQVDGRSRWKASRRVDVTGTTKGRGFTGAMKRHNFKASGPRTA